MSKPNNTRVCPGQSRVEDPLPDDLKTCCSETPTAKYRIYNRAVWNSRRPAKTSQQHAPWSSSSLPRPPKKKDQHPPQKTSPSSSSSPVRCRDRSHRQSPSANPVQRTSTEGSTPRTSKRPRVDAIKNALFESCCHCAGNSDGLAPTTSPEGTQPRRVSAQWTRTSAHWPQSGG